MAECDAYDVYNSSDESFGTIKECATLMNCFMVHGQSSRRPSHLKIPRYCRNRSLMFGGNVTRADLAKLKAATIELNECLAARAELYATGDHTVIRRHEQVHESRVILDALDNDRFTL